MPTRALAAAAVAVLLLSGCAPAGGGSGDPSTGSGSPSPSTEATPTPTPTEDSIIPPSTAVDAALFFVPEWREGVSFISPSGNLSCGIYSTAGVLEMWGCAAKEREWEFADASPGDPCYDPDRPIGCGDGIVVLAEFGPVPVPLSRGGAEFADEGGLPTRALQYGESVTYLTVTCASTDQHVVCADLSTGHGFVISRNENTIL